MREIKFRAWNKKTKLPAHPIFDITNSFNGTNYIIEQYTGLKDLYEGDLIKDNDGIIWEVIFWEASFTIRQIKNHDEMMPIASFWKYEVIGNIHENPELL